MKSFVYPSEDNHVHVCPKCDKVELCHYVECFGFEGLYCGECTANEIIESEVMGFKEKWDRLDNELVKLANRTREILASWDHQGIPF